MKSSPRYSSFLLLALVAIVIAVATIVEDAMGSPFAHLHIYGSLWFKLLWGAVTVYALKHIWYKRLWNRPALLFLHLSFAVILAGALTTSITSRKEILHLRKCTNLISPKSPNLTFPEGEDFQDNSTESSPLGGIKGGLGLDDIKLTDFSIRYYPGTEAPQDFISQIIIENKPYTVSMNRIATHKGWRFYQSSYDPDLQGSILTATYDPWGTPVTYLGYALLTLSILLFLCMERKTSPDPLPQEKEHKHITIRIVISLFIAISALTTIISPLPMGEGAGEGLILWNNRPTPFSVMAKEFMLKVYGKESYDGLPANKVVIGILKEPHLWSTKEIIKIKRGKYRSLSSYVNKENGTLQGLGQDPKEDEKVALLLMLMQGTLIQPLPADMEPPSPMRIKAELLYHSHDWLLWCIILLTAASLLSLWKIKTTSSPALSLVEKASFFTFHFSLFTLSTLWIIRWYISDHIPLSNGYETLIFVSICMLLAAEFHPRLCMASAGASILLLLVARMGAMNPQITPLMPVLHSPWLSAHVSIIMISYALLALSIVERKLLRPAVCLMAIGIFLGAVWANVSWGTYWSWDPKESWALITMLVYCIPLHQQSIPWFRSLRNYRIYSILALACLLMTYFGVNFLLGGMHSYGAS